MPVTNRFQNPGRPYHFHPKSSLEAFEEEAAPWLQLVDEYRHAREKAGDEWEAELPTAGDSRVDVVGVLLQIILSMERLALQKLTESVWYIEGWAEKAEEVPHV